MIALMRKSFPLPTVAACLSLVILAPALPGQTDDKMAKVQAVAQQLQLTPDQKVKVLPILEQEAPKLEAIKNNSSLSGMEKMKQLRAIHAETAPELQRILSPAQYQKFRLSGRRESRKRLRINALGTDLRPSGSLAKPPPCWGIAILREI